MLPLLLDPEQFNAHPANNSSDKLLIVDLGSQERFEQKHLPNAVLVTPAQTQAGKPIPGFIPNPEALQSLMQSIGYAADKHIVVYDDEGGGWAGRFIWMLDEIGHSNYSYLDGGVIAWEALGYELASGASTPKASDCQVSASNQHTITADALISQLEDSHLTVWDARSPGEHSGEKKNAARAGRIPGAINYEWTDAMDKQNYLRLKPLDILKQELLDRGISMDQKIVTHCQSHHRSGLTYLIAKLLGAKEVLAYAGSWGEWGNREDTPVEI